MKPFLRKALWQQRKSGKNSTSFLLMDNKIQALHFKNVHKNPHAM